MRYLHRLLLLLLLCINISAYSQSKQYTVTANSLNVRSEPSVQSAVVGSLKKGETVTVQAINNNWATILYNGKNAYISTTYITLNDTSGASVSKQGKVSNTTGERNKGQSNTSKFKSGASLFNSYHRMDRELLWEFSTGFMIRHQDYYIQEKVRDLSFMLGAEAPLTIGNIDFLVHGGLRYLNRKTTNEASPGDFYVYHCLDIPVKIDYELPIAKNFSLMIGTGPYYTHVFDELLDVNIFGFEHEVALRFKNCSLGLQYSTPFYNKYEYSDAEYCTINFSIRFNNKAWRGIGIGLASAAVVAAAVGTVVDGGNQSSNTAYYPDYAYLDNSLYVQEHAKIMQTALRDIYRDSASDIFNKGANYYFGENGYKQDYKKAFDCFLEAANQGDSNAQFNLGFMYEFGEGVEKKRQGSIKLVQESC